MTATEVQNYARVLSNSSWCRYWLLWNAGEDGCEVAIQCRDEKGKPLLIHDAISRGFTRDENFFYTAPRTTDDGKPYYPKML